MNSSEKFPLISVAAAVIRKDGRLLIASRPRKSDFSEYWELPGGKMRLGESPAECVERELQEELNAEIIALDTIFQTRWDYPEKRVIIFFVRAFERRNSCLSPQEGQEIAWVRMDDFLEYNILAADMLFLEFLNSPF